MQAIARPGGRVREVGDPVPPHIGLGVNAVRAPDPDGVAMRERVATKGGDQRGTAREQQICGLDELQGERGVEQVRRRHAEMHVRRRFSRLRVVGPGAEERDDIVLGGGLDLGDGFRGRWLCPPDRFDCVARHPTGVGVRRQDEGLDPAPQLVLVRLAPDGTHLRQRVALDHARHCRARPVRTPSRLQTDGVRTEG